MKSRVSKPAASKSQVESFFQRRAARATLLARESAAADGPLRFAAGLYEVQGRLASAIESLHKEAPLCGKLGDDLDRLLGGCRELVQFASESGPEVLARQARARQEEDPSVTRSRLLVYWNGDQAASEDYLSRATLRPYAEVARTLGVAIYRLHRRGYCPVCGGPPWIGARRDGSDSEGARRFLSCALCGGEWLVGRILCPSCFEEDPAKLPVFQSDRYPAVRVEACETCRRYVKSLDLSRDARPIPEVDDLVSLSMDLWAVQQGWTRIEPGLAGL